MMGFYARSSAGIIFYDDCEDYPNLSKDWRLVGVGPSLPHDRSVFEVSSEQARAGSKSYKFVLPPYGTDGTSSNAKRTELRLAGRGSRYNINNFEYNREFWIGYSLYIPKDFVVPGKTPGEWGLIGQWHSTPDACESAVRLNPTAAFYFQYPSYQKFVIQGVSMPCSTAKKERWIDYQKLPFNKGAWNDIVLNFKLGHRSADNPFFKVWINGEQKVSDRGINCWNDAKGPYFKIGIYAIQHAWLTIYVDEFRVGDQNSSYAEVAPTGDR